MDDDTRFVVIYNMQTQGNKRSKRTLLKKRVCLDQFVFCIFGRESSTFEILKVDESQISSVNYETNLMSLINLSLEHATVALL